MITREDIIGESRRLGFGDVGFTTAEPFTAHLDYLRSHQAEYGWVEKAGWRSWTGRIRRRCCLRQSPSSCSWSSTSVKPFRLARKPFRPLLS